MCCSISVVVELAGSNLQQTRKKAAVKSSLFVGIGYGLGKNVVDISIERSFVAGVHTIDDVCCRLGVPSA